MQMAAPSHLRSANMSYNPITNPIPVINQNPYISKGRLDHIITVRPRGKIVTTQEHFQRERLSIPGVNK